MYSYFKGFIFREGTHGVSGNILKSLYEEVGWVSQDMPLWQNEKFEISLNNSAWAYTVWDKDEIIGMVRVISDKVMYAAIQDLIVRKDYQGKGIGKKLVELCIQKLPHGNWFVHTVPYNYEFYRKCGFDISDASKEDTLVYLGYKKSKIDGHREV